LEIEWILNKNNIKFEKIPYLSNWYRLVNSKEKDLRNLDIFSEWKIYLQWITSQLVWEILKDDIKGKNIKILDLTASPGWKTSHVSAILQNNWEIIANELNKIRFEKLNFTIKRQGCQNVKTINQDARNLKNIFESDYFDVIIADLPCSSEWRINLNNEKSYKFLEKKWINTKNYNIQKNILKETIGLLKNNWILIYSTCTLDPKENEWIVHFLLSNYKNLQIQDINNKFEDKNIKKYLKTWIKSFDKYIYNSQTKKSIRILPSIDTEWFFIAKFRKIWL
jgi:16S rRNA C967 or C1407 C5-methylase (RsmB/RsmF family)